MEPVNYCRQYRQHILGKSQPSDEDRRVLFLAASSHKFMLPKGGVLFDDSEFRAIADEGALHLPFGVIALEFEYPQRGIKTIIFVEELEFEFRVTPVAFHKELNWWSRLSGGWYVAKHGALFVGRDGKICCSYKEGLDEELQIEEVEPHGAFVVLFSFLNALACSNVEAKKLPEPKQPKKAKAALPFDSYYVLTVNAETSGAREGGPIGAHRSPREHLRRGHIRTYESGLKIWVNAAVVNPGVGGRVSKDYRIAA